MKESGNETKIEECERNLAWNPTFEPVLILALTSLLSVLATT